MNKLTITKYQKKRGVCLYWRPDRQDANLTADERTRRRDQNIIVVLFRVIVPEARRALSVVV